MKVIGKKVLDKGMEYKNFKMEIYMMDNGLIKLEMVKEN